MERRKVVTALRGVKIVLLGIAIFLFLDGTILQYFLSNPYHADPPVDLRRSYLKVALSIILFATAAFLQEIKEIIERGEK